MSTTSSPVPYAARPRTTDSTVTMSRPASGPSASRTVSATQVSVAPSSQAVSAAAVTCPASRGGAASSASVPGRPVDGNSTTSPIRVASVHGTRRVAMVIRIRRSAGATGPCPCPCPCLVGSCPCPALRGRDAGSLIRRCRARVWTDGPSGRSMRRILPDRESCTRTRCRAGPRLRPTQHQHILARAASHLTSPRECRAERPSALSRGRRREMFLVCRTRLEPRRPGDQRTADRIVVLDAGRVDRHPRRPARPGRRLRGTARRTAHPLCSAPVLGVGRTCCGYPRPTRPAGQGVAVRAEHPLDDPASTWSVGVPGAIAEFARSLGEDVVRAPGTARTQRGAIRPHRRAPAHGDTVAASYNSC